MSDDALNMRGPVLGTKDAKRVAVGSAVGAVIETYDFIGFGTAAALYFGHAFFPNSSPVAGTLAAFATLGVGFAARPLGGIIGGHLGDKVGRNPCWWLPCSSWVWPRLPSACCPPTPRSACWRPSCWSPSASVQGLAFGAEWGGAILMSYEHAPWKEKGRYTGIVQAGFPVGAVVGEPGIPRSACHIGRRLGLAGAVPGQHRARSSSD